MVDIAGLEYLTLTGRLDRYLSGRFFASIYKNR